MATPHPTSAGTAGGRMRRKKRIGEGVYYTWHESSIILKRELCVRKRVKFLESSDKLLIVFHRRILMEIISIVDTELFIWPI